MSILPEKFQDLEPIAGVWSLATETARNRQRLASSMEEMTRFSETLLPRLDEIFEYLDQFAVDKLPDAASKNLFYLTLSLAEVAPALETYGQQRVIDGLHAERVVADEHFKLRPIP
jgi:hypothetical protein